MRRIGWPQFDIKAMPLERTLLCANEANQIVAVFDAAAVVGYVIE
jgi:hypothetical protein